MDKHILVVDDNDVLCDLMQSALNESGYSVEIANTGEEGIEKAMNKEPDLIFMDIEMPGIGGIEALRHLRMFLPKIPIYIVTGFQIKYMQILRNILEEGITFEVCNKPLGVKTIQELADCVLKPVELDSVVLSLKLYISGIKDSSTKVVEQVEKIFKYELNCKYELEIINLIKEPQRAEEDNIIVTPTLVMINPSPKRVIIGNLSNAENVLAGLGLHKKI